MANILNWKDARSIGADTPTQPRLLEQVRDAIRRKHYSIRTEQAYIQWIRRYVLFHSKRHPREMGAAEVEQFLTHLAVAGRVTASTQNQALNAIVFLYRVVLEKDLGQFACFEHAKRPERLPVVFTREEVRAILSRLEGTRWLMASLIIRRWSSLDGMRSAPRQGLGSRPAPDRSA